MSTSDNNSNNCYSCLDFLILLLLFIFHCIALTYSDNDTYYAACGHTLRDLMVGGIVILSAGLLIVYIIIMILGFCGFPKAAGVFGMVSVFFYFISLLILSGLILNYSIISLNNANCTAAMRSTDGGINSISANTGSPFIAIIGIVNSSWALVRIVYTLCLLTFNDETYYFFKREMYGAGQF